MFQRKGVAGRTGRVILKPGLYFIINGSCNCHVCVCLIVLLMFIVISFGLYFSLAWHTACGRFGRWGTWTGGDTVSLSLSLSLSLASSSGRREGSYRRYDNIETGNGVHCCLWYVHVYILCFGSFYFSMWHTACGLFGQTGTLTGWDTVSLSLSLASDSGKRV